MRINARPRIFLHLSVDFYGTIKNCMDFCCCSAINIFMTAEEAMKTHNFRVILPSFPSERNIFFFTLKSIAIKRNGKLKIKSLISGFTNIFMTKIQFVSSFGLMVFIGQIIFHFFRTFHYRLFIVDRHIILIIVLWEKTKNINFIDEM